MKHSALSDVQIKAARPKDRRYSLIDGRNLELEVMTSGRKFWRLTCRIDGKRQRKTLGEYPYLSLTEARVKADELRAEVARGTSLADAVDPPRSETFEDIVREWLDVRLADKSEGHNRVVRSRLDKHILPVIGDLPLSEITSGRILRLLREIEAAGKIETCLKVRGIIGQVFRFAIATDRAETDPTAALRGALASRQVRHMATLTDPAQIGILMRLASSYEQPITRCALLMSLYTFQRPGEIRQSEWSEIDLGAAEWRIPPCKMKLRRLHIAPLATQVIELLEGLKPLTGRQKWLFPSARGDGRPLSDGTVRIALRSLGFGKDQLTPHGIRGMASTWANEAGWNRDVIERQLAHVERNAVRGAYNHAEYLDERRRLMQAWADHLDALRDDAGNT